MLLSFLFVFFKVLISLYYRYIVHINLFHGTLHVLFSQGRLGSRAGHALFDPGEPGFARGFPRFLPSFPYRHLAASHWDLFYVIVYILGYVRNKSES